MSFERADVGLASERLQGDDFGLSPGKLGAPSNHHGRARGSPSKTKGNSIQGWNGNGRIDPFRSIRSIEQTLVLDARPSNQRAASRPGRSGAIVRTARVRCSTHPDNPFARIRRQSPRVSPSCTRVFGPIDAMIRDRRLGSARTIAQFRATDTTHRPVLRDRDGAFTTARDFFGVLAGALARVLAGVRGVARDDEPFFAGVGAGAADLAIVRREGAGAGAGSTTTVDSGGATVPADCIVTGGASDTGGAAASWATDSESSAATAESAWTIATAESGMPTVSTRAATFRPIETGAGWFVGRVSATKVGAGAVTGAAVDGVSRLASHAPMASDANVSAPTAFHR